MTLDQVIAISASVAAALSAIATLLTVKEMAKQRQASYRPELVFERKRYTVRRKNDKEGAPSFWSSANNSEAGENHEFTIDLINIGLGSAKAVTLTWDFETETALKTVNETAQRSLLGEFFEFTNGAFSIQSRGNEKFASFWDVQRIQQIDFVLPSEEAKRPIQVRIPHAYLVMYSHYMYYVSTIRKWEDYSFPTLKVRIDYTDIGDKIYSVEFDLEFKLEAVEQNASKIYGNIIIARTEKSRIALEIAKEAAIITASASFPFTNAFIQKIAEVLQPTRSKR